MRRRANIHFTSCHSIPFHAASPHFSSLRFRRSFIPFAHFIQCICSHFASFIRSRRSFMSFDLFQSISQSINQQIKPIQNKPNQSIHQSIHPFIHPSINPVEASQSVNPCIQTSIRQSINPTQSNPIQSFLHRPTHFISCSFSSNLTSFLDMSYSGMSFHSFIFYSFGVLWLHFNSHTSMSVHSIHCVSCQRVFPLQCTQSIHSLNHALCISLLFSIDILLLVIQF